MSGTNQRLSLGFSSFGHALMHYYTACYFVVVLSLEEVWRRPYHELIELWTLGALLVGACALPAGWLADRWSAPGMMAVMFFGLGAAGILAGLAEAPPSLRWGLAGIGVFAAIYHPVGIAWVVRSSTSRGRALGINGVFGSLGVAAGGALAGLLIDLAGWRAAFVLPAGLGLAAGLALVACLRLGYVRDVEAPAAPRGAAGRAEQARAFALLLLAMAGVGILFQAMQAALPKLFDVRLAGRLGDGRSGVGSLVALVYLIAGLTQLVGGQLADRLPLKHVYVAGLALAVPLQALLATVGGWSVVLVAALAAFANAGVLPAENLLLAHYAPAKHRSLAYGLKFVVAFGTAPLAVWLVAVVQERTGGLDALFLVLALLAAASALLAVGLPAPGPAPVSSPSLEAGRTA